MAPKGKQTRLTGSLRREKSEYKDHVALKNNELRPRAPKRVSSLEQTDELTDPKKLDEKWSKNSEVLDLLKQWTDSSPKYHQENMSPVVKLLNLFDMKVEYGPCTGLTRLDRWKRAKKLHKDPPELIERVLISLGDVDIYKYSSLSQ